MPLIKLFVTPALLLLVLACPVWPASLSTPAVAIGKMTDSCDFYAKALLQNISYALTKERELFHGLNCAMRIIELSNETDTPSVCAPKGSTCLGTAKSEFDQDSCLKNINEDLHYYYKFLDAQSDPDNILEPVLLRLKELMQNCFTWTQQSYLTTKKNRSSSFQERVQLCKVLKGFQVRTITINRAIGYMKSGEHTR